MPYLCSDISTNISFLITSNKNILVKYAGKIFVALLAPHGGNTLGVWGGLSHLGFVLVPDILFWFGVHGPLFYTNYNDNDAKQTNKAKTRFAFYLTSTEILQTLQTL